MADQPSSRRFQFRLRTLFIAVTLLAVALGFVFHKINRTREREAFIASHRATAAFGYSSRSENADDELIDVFLAPWTTDAELETARRLFPEATVVRLK
jgi:hypothetical protein